MKDEGITLLEIKALRSELILNIRECIGRFEAISGLAVTAVDIDRLDVGSPREPKTVLGGIDIRTELR